MVTVGQSAALSALTSDDARAVREAAILLRDNGARAVWLFGSVAKGRAPTVHSDFDFAVEGLPAGRFLGCLGQLLQQLPRPVDLVDLDRASASLRARVRQEGILLSP